jgi:hypothetical protein
LKLRQVLCKANDTCNFLAPEGDCSKSLTLFVSFISFTVNVFRSADSAVSTFDTNRIFAVSVKVYAIICHSIALSSFPMLRSDFTSENPFILTINHRDCLDSHISSHNKHPTIAQPSYSQPTVRSPPNLPLAGRSAAANSTQSSALQNRAPPNLGSGQAYRKTRNRGDRSTLPVNQTTNPHPPSYPADNEMRSDASGHFTPIICALSCEALDLDASASGPREKNVTNFGGQRRSRASIKAAFFRRLALCSILRRPPQPAPETLPGFTYTFLKPQYGTISISAYTWTTRRTFG